MPSNKSQRRIARDIKRQQNSVKNVIPQTSFQRVVAEIIQDSETEEALCVREEAVSALQCEAENFVTQAFDAARQLAEYNNRDTVTREDLRFVLNLQGFSSRDGKGIETQDALMAPCEDENCDE